jgi:MFS family permease
MATVSRLAVPFLGAVGSIQGAAPIVASTALVSVRRDLHLTVDATALAASIQTLAVAATVITSGLLADRLGRRRVLVAALLLSVAGSLITAAASAPLIYLAGQAVTGIGLGAVFGAAFAYVRAVAAPDRLPQALGLFGAVAGLTTMAMVFTGSVLVGINWRLAFALLAGVAVVGVALVPLLLPVQPRIVHGAMDISGQLLLAAGIVGLLYGVSRFGSSLTAATTLIPLIVGTACVIGFFLREAKSPNAFYPVALFRSPLFLAAIMAGFILNFGSAVGFLQTTNLWQYVTGVHGSSVAIWQLPLNGFAIVGALITGRIMTRGLSNGTVLLAAGILGAVGFIAWGLARGAHSVWAFLPGSAAVGFALAAASIPFGNLILKVAPTEQFGPVTSSRTTIGQVFFTLGSTLSTVALDRLTMGGTVRRLEAADVDPDRIAAAVSSVNAYVSAGTRPTDDLARQALRTAASSYLAGFAMVMYVTAALLLLAGVLGYGLCRRGINPER